MASLLFPIATITLLLFVFAPTPSVAGPVLDGKGNIVVNGGTYFILPHLIGSGGLTITESNNTSEACPLYVAPQMYTRGSPIRLYTPLKTPYIPTSAPVALTFEFVTTSCNIPLRWWVLESTKTDDHSYIIVGVNEEFEDEYYFKFVVVDEAKYVYNIKFCSTVEYKGFRVSKEECDDVTVLDNGLLGVKSNSPFPVTLMNAKPRLASYV